MDLLFRLLLVLSFFLISTLSTKKYNVRVSSDFHRNHMAPLVSYVDDIMDKKYDMPQYLKDEGTVKDIVITKKLDAIDAIINAKQYYRHIIIQEQLMLYSVIKNIRLIIIGLYSSDWGIVIENFINITSELLSFLIFPVFMFIYAVVMLFQPSTITYSIVWLICSLFNILVFAFITVYLFDGYKVLCQIINHYPNKLIDMFESKYKKQ